MDEACSESQLRTLKTLPREPIRNSQTELPLDIGYIKRL